MEQNGNEEMIPTISLTKLIQSMIQYIEAKLEPNNGLDFNIKVLKFNGMWPVKDANGQLNNFDYYFPRFFLSIALVYLTVVFPMGVYHSWGDIPAVTEQLVALFVVLTVVSKAGSLAFQPEAFQQLANKMELISRQCQLGTKGEEKIKKRTQLFTNWMIAMYVGFTNSIVGGSILMFPFLLYIREFYIRGWYPFDAYASPKFELVLVVGICAVNLTSLIAAVDIYFFALLIQIIGQFKLLRHNLSNMRQLAVDDVVGRKHATGRQDLQKHFAEREEVMRFSRDHIMNVGNDDLEINIEGLEPVASPFTVSVKQIASTNEEVDMLMILRIKECVRHHQDICEFVNELQETFFYILITQVMCNVFPSALTALWASTVHTLDHKAVCFVWLFSTCIIEFFLYCYLSNILTEESSKVADAVYDIDWFDAPESFKRSMGIMMAKANQPAVIMIAGYIPLSMETFQNVQDMAYSYYTTLSSTTNY